MRIEMNKDENLKAAVIESCINGTMTVKFAAERLNFSERYVKKLKARYKKFGASSMIHGNCGKQPKHTIDANIKSKIWEIWNTPELEECNFTHFQELLEERENIKISYSSVYKILTESGIKSKKKHKDRKTHRQRKRKQHMGELVQADGTPFDWFKDGHMYSIHGFIDDATGKVLGAYMCENECLLGYLEVLRQMLTDYGIPQCLYPDKHSRF